MLLRISTIFAVAASIAGCAAGPYAYQQNMMQREEQESIRLTKIRESSLKIAGMYAEEVSLFLKKHSEKEAIAKAQKTIADSLKDPNSAQFRNVRLVPYKTGSVICGEVNGKNSYGGYVGFKRFISSTAIGEIEHTGSNVRYQDWAMNSGLDDACEKKP